MDTVKFKVIVQGKKLTIMVPYNDSYKEPDRSHCDIVDKWFEMYNAGHRISWDTWVAKSDKLVTRFLLEWT